MLCLFRTVFILISLVFAAGSSVLAANWYVDKNATGANNGTSWANAWTSLEGIGWTDVNPGDTVFISGGSTGKTYSVGLAIGKSGTPGNPITIRIGQDAGHNGSVSMNGLSWGAHKWVTVNGSKGSPVPPKNVLEVESREFVNSIGLWVSSSTGTAAYMTAPVGNQMLWCGITNVVRGSASLAHGFWANVSQAMRTTNNVIKYNLISHTEDDGIAWVGNQPATSHGEVEVAFNIIEYVGDDGLEANHGFSVHDNVIGPCIQLHGHPDGIQSVGSFWKVYNNKFYDFLNAFLRMQATQTNHSDVMIFNNAFISGVPYPEPYNPLINTGIEMMQYGHALGELPLMVWSNIVVANNTFYSTNSSQTGITLGWGKRSETTPNAFVHNVVLTNVIVANNLSYVRNPKVETDSSIGVGWQPWKTAAPWGSAPTYQSEKDVVFDWNTAAGTHSGVRKVSYFGVNHDSGEALALVSIWKNNKSTAPLFVQEGVNFELAANDTSALNRGTNLSSIFNFDILNRPRNVDGAWDRGAFERGGSTGAAPGAFSLVNPVSGAQGQSLTPTLNWNLSSTATSYKIEISASSSFSVLSHTATTTSSSYVVPGGVLATGGSYYWRVRASNAVGSILAVNAPFLFSTSSQVNSPGSFSLASPGSNVGGLPLTPTFTWSDASGEDHYVFEISDKSTFPSPLVLQATLPANTVSYQVASGELDSSKQYYWRVRAVNAQSETWADYSPRGFTTTSEATVSVPGAFSLAAPASNMTDVPLTATFAWTDALRESSYVLEIDSENTFASPLVHQATLSSDTVSYQVPSGELANGMQYFWRVRAINSAGQTVADFSPRAFLTGNASSSGVQTNGLLVWLKFDDDFSDSSFQDSSGNGNHGRRFGRIGSSYPANSPARVLASSAAGSAIRTNLASSDYAGDFVWGNTGYGIYGNEGAYAGITNGMSKLTNMATATIMCWARYESAPGGNNYSVDGNATLLSAGTSAGVPGAWDFGRYNKSIWLNNTRFYFITNQATFARTIIEFPDRGYDNRGDTTNWQHYAITWDNGVVKGYLNGKPFVTNDSSAVVTTLKVGRNPNVASPWIGIGCNTHAGTPHLDDESPNIEYPNHGWMNGSIDDVRIYERVLSAAEVQAIVSGNASGPVEPELPARPTGLRLALP